MTGMTEAYDWRGRTLVDRHGDEIGEVGEIFLDNETNRVEWALVRTGLLGTKQHFVPLAGAEPAGEHVRVAVEKKQVQDSPVLEADEEISQEQEELLYRHYGFTYSDARSQSGLPQEALSPTPAAQAEDDPAGEPAMTRSEEELRAGVRQRERGRARLRKYVVTEHQTRTVPVRREEVRVEREPVTEADAAATGGSEISEEEREVVLHEEEPVVEKRVVPKERVRLDKETVTDEAEISEEVRREEIEAEGER